MSNKNLIALLHALSGAACIVFSLFSKGQIPIPEQPIKTIGFLLFALGSIAFVYAAANLRSAFQGNIDPVTDRLVTNGPYRFVRHPLYLAMIIMCVGLSIGLRSVLGLAIAFIVFLPLGVHRARLEEEGLTLRFGKDWEEYSERTRFFLPFFNG